MRGESTSRNYERIKMEKELSGTLKYRELRAPVTVQMALTERCNNICRYCYNSSRGLKKQSLGVDLEKSLRIAKQIADNQVFETVLTGGEPLLRRDLLYPVGAYLTSENVDVKMNTNLVLLNDRDVRDIKESGIIAVFGSLSSHDEATYNNITQTENYREAVRGIELLLTHQVPVAINMVVTQLNKEQVYETGKFLKDLGVMYFCATPASPCDYMNPNLELNRTEIVRTLDDLLRLKKEFSMSVDVVEPLPRCITRDSEKYEHFLRRDCAAGKITVYVTPEGEVTPCTHVSTGYGNLLNQDLRSIWMRMREWRNGFLIPKKCSPCTELDLCSTGCREAANIKTGSYQGMDIWADEPIKTSRTSSSNGKLLALDTRLRVVNGLKFREEDEGYSIFTPETHSITYANPELLRFVVDLRKRGDFTTREIIGDYGNEEEVCSILRLLNNREVIKQ